MAVSGDWPIASRAHPRGELLACFFHVLADSTRVRIVELLIGGEKNVSELVEALGIQQGRVSSHLACLKRSVPTPPSLNPSSSRGMWRGRRCAGASPSRSPRSGWGRG